MTNAQEELLVPLGERTYPITVGHGILHEVGEALTARVPGRQVALVSDETVWPLYGDQVSDSLGRAGCTVTRAILPAGEEHKTLSSVAELLDTFLDARLDRQSSVVALGGGVVGDMAGFAAAVLLRGVRFAQIPTTVVAQVDASTGGKTGVDHRRGKNLIGAFHQPSLVYIDVSTLRSLPPRELRGGLAEVLKHAVIRDSALFADLETDLGLYAAFDAQPAQWVRLVAQNCRLKADVVSQDERETGLRAILNYGHTTAHAIEVLGGYERYRHGEAVLYGMRVAGALAAERGMWSREDLRRQNALIDVLAPADAPTDMSPDDLLRVMQSDKKVRDGVIRFVLPTRIGDATVVDDITEQEFVSAWRNALTGASAPPS